MKGLTKQHPELAKAAADLETILDERKGWFLAQSDPGKGKSVMLCAMVNEATNQGLTAVYYSTTAEMLQQFQDAQTGKGPMTYSALMRILQGVDVLALNEFGENSDSPFRLTILRELLVARSEPRWVPATRGWGRGSL
jgi:DNA replication protein DnaC